MNASPSDQPSCGLIGFQCGKSSLNRSEGRVLAAGAVGGEADDVAGIEVGELQPILGDVAGGEEVVLAVFLGERVDEILAVERGFGAESDGAFDRVFFRAFDDGGDDGSAGEVAAEEVVVATAAVGDIQEAVFILLE